MALLGFIALSAAAQPGPARKVPPQLPPQASDQARQKVAEHTAPTVTLTAPAAGALYTAPATVVLEATASASSGGKSITQVEFFAGATLIGTATAVPYRFTWGNVIAGAYSLTARATDNLGVATTSAAVSIIVNAPPTVSLTSPSNNALFTAPAAITLTANAADADGSIAQVEFFQGATLIATVTHAPYTFSLTNVAAGSYMFSALATDDRSASVTSAPVAVRVNAPPSASLTSPGNSAVFTAPATIPLSASATDADGTIARVEFYSGASLIGTVTAPPYSIDWTQVPAGAYSLTARATDDLGAVTTSAPVAVTVNAPPSVGLTSPADGATFTAPATIALTAEAADADGTIARVEFYNGTSLIATVTSSPYGINWTQVPAGSYSLTARVTDNLGATTTSTAVSVTVTQALAQIYYIHTDHLNTPRAIYDQSQRLVWRWDNLDPFGGNAPDENPSGLGNFTCNLRFPGQYFDKETNLHYNYFRDYDPGIGRYVQSDPIGLLAGQNLYSYVVSNPLDVSDSFGLDITIKYFPPFPPGHIGIAVNSEDTVGLYPRLHREAVNACKSVPGAVARDRILQSPEDYKNASVLRIKTTHAQDRIIQRRLDMSSVNPSDYNWCSSQCSTFVLNMLRTAGVPAPEGTFVRPDTLFDALEKMYLRKQ